MIRIVSVADVVGRAKLVVVVVSSSEVIEHDGQRYALDDFLNGT